MKKIAYLPVALMFCLVLCAFEASAQNEWDFTMTLRLKNRTWTHTKTLAADVVIKNTGRKDLYISHKCDFGFAGYLERAVSAYEAIRYEITWDKTSQICVPQREDFIKISPGKKVSIAMTSVKIKEVGDSPAVPPKGWYTLFVRYGTSKIAPFEGVFLGTSNTNKVRLLVK
jgi:hypothetical protein